MMQRENRILLIFGHHGVNSCEMEAPDLVRMYDKYKKDVEIFAVNATIGDPVQEASAFADRHGFKFPVLLDMDGVAGLDYKVFSLPTTFLLIKMALS